MKSRLRTSPIAVCHALILALCTAVATAQAEPAREEEPGDIVGRVQKSIRELGGPDYALREAAHRALRNLTDDDLTLLGKYYRETDDFEVRLRIEEICVQAFFIRNLPDVSAFLGISAEPVSAATNSRVEQGMTGFKVNHVVQGSSADVIGMQPGDCIIAIDGESFMEGVDFTLLSYRLRSRRAGVLTRLDFYRGYELKSVRFPIGADTRNSASQQFRPVGSPDEGIEAYQRAIKSFPIWWRTHFEPQGRRDPSAMLVPQVQNPQSRGGDRSPPEPAADDSEKRE